MSANSLRRAVILLLSILLPATIAVAQPTDFGIQITNVDRDLIRELAPFASIVTLSVEHPQFREMLLYAQIYDIEVSVYVEPLLFGRPETPNGSPKPPLRLFDDAAERWQAFVEDQGQVISGDRLWGFYLVDEPFFRGVIPSELEQAQRIVEATFPHIPTATSLNTIDLDTAPTNLPTDVLDIVGFHQYAVTGNLSSDPGYQGYIDLLLSKFPDREYMIVADTWWQAGRHGVAGLSLADMGRKIQEYRTVAEQIGAKTLGAFIWESLPGSTGLRDFPDQPLREVLAVAADVSNKCGIPGDADPKKGDSILFLQDCRFFVTVRWRDPNTGEEGDAVAVPQSSDTGLFWFFSPSNIELTFKIIDGRSFNDHWWVFWSHLSSLELLVSITDTFTGRNRLYAHPASDTRAFEDPPVVDPP